MSSTNTAGHSFRSTLTGGDVLRRTFLKTLLANVIRLLRPAHCSSTPCCLMPNDRPGAEAPRCHLRNNVVPSLPCPSAQTLKLVIVGLAVLPQARLQSLRSMTRQADLPGTISSFIVQAPLVLVFVAIIAWQEQSFLRRAESVRYVGLNLAIRVQEVKVGIGRSWMSLTD